jgi:uncharacterized membrane protein YozB (DUF420 family)
LDGFLGTRASLMLDVVVVAMLVIVPLMSWSIYLVKFRRRYQAHKRIQLTLGAVLLVAIIAFEADMRVSGWTQRAVPSPYWSGSGWNDWVHYSLAVHLLFAIPTAVLWLVVIVQALRKFPVPPMPNRYSPRHISWARLAAAEMVMTAVTGWWFYWLAFVAE